jgi:hypothetical protein
MEISGQLHVIDALPLGKRRCFELNRKLVGPQSWSACCGEEKPLLLLSGI